MKLANYFQNDMVIQRDKPIVIFGTCEENEKIKIRLSQNGVLLYEAKQTFKNTFTFEAPKVSNTKNKLDIELSGNKHSQSIEAYIGDVFLLTGQSNMVYSFYVTNDYPIQSKLFLPEFSVRYLDLVDKEVIDESFQRSLEPRTEIDGDRKWFGNESVKERDDFSAIGTIFGNLYYQKHRIPVGLVNVAVGGCSIDAFLPEHVIFSDNKIKDYLKGKNKINDTNVTAYSYTQSAGIYNEKVSPLVNLHWKAVFWYQGEHHVGDHLDGLFYEHALETLINTYRSIFQDDILPFGCIQIANNYYPQDLGYSIPFINEAIQAVSFKLKEVFTIPLYDTPIKWQNERIGDAAMLIHPTNKTFVATRLFEVFDDRTFVPYIEKYEVIESKIYLTIKNVKLGLKTKQGFNVQGFTIADKSGRYYKADASIIDHETIVIENTNIKHPKDFMYGFYLYNSDANVVNSSGYPLLIFRSNRSHNDCENLFSYHPLFDLTHEHVYELGFFPLIAYPKLNRRFLEGQINLTGKMTLNQLNHQYLACHFMPENKGMNYFGFSPNTNLRGTRLRLFPDEICELIYETNENELLFSGILVKTITNNVFQFPVVSKTKKGKNNHALVHLNKVFDAALTPTETTKAFLDTVKDLQFVFESKTDVEVIIKSIKFFSEFEK